MTDETTTEIGIWSNEFNKVFEQVFERSLIGMAIVSSEGQFLKVNQKVCSIWEYSEKELLGKNWRDITHPDDIQKSEHYINSYEDKHEQYHEVLEKRYITGTGKTIICKITTITIRNQEGYISYFVTQVRDITQNKEAISSIQKSLEYIQIMKERIT